MAEFSELGITQDLIKGITELNIISPSEIQEKAIPILVKGDADFFGQAQTGTGKTAAFGLPLLTHKNRKGRDSRFNTSTYPRAMSTNWEAAF